MYLFAAACYNVGLIITMEKTVVMHQPPPNAAYNSPQINVNDALLQVVDTFTYLGNTLYRSTKIEDQVARRVFKVGQAFGRFQKTVWHRHCLHLNTKLESCKVFNLPALLYGAET
nr:unnamed protein product [Spirometra erinaceieuropaei]